MKYIHIKIDNACLMITEYGAMTNYHFTKDGYVADERFIKHNDKVIIENPFYLHHVSNMLHVMCGCRPVKTFHSNTDMKRVDVIDKVAMRSLYRINNPYYSKYTDKKGNEYYKFSTQFSHGQPFVEDSNVKELCAVSSTGIKFPGSVLMWEYFEKKYVKTKKINEFIKFIYACEEVSGLSYNEIKYKYSLVDFLLKISEDKDKRRFVANVAKDLTTMICKILYHFVIVELSKTESYDEYLNILDNYKDELDLYFNDGNFCLKSKNIEKQYFKESKGDFNIFKSNVYKQYCNIKGLNFVHTAGERITNEAIIVNQRLITKRCPLYIDLYVPCINDLVTKAILTGPRCATFLDGGVAEVVEYGEEYSEDYLKSINFKTVVDNGL